VACYFGDLDVMLDHSKTVIISILLQVINLDTYLLHERRKDEKLVEDKTSKVFTNREAGSGHTAFQSQSNLGKGIGSEKDYLRRTGTRISLTCRHVPKVYKNFLRL
jgi:hypothetical protein